MSTQPTHPRSTRPTHPRHRAARSAWAALLLAPVLASPAAPAPAQADPRVGGEIGVRYEALGGARGFLGRPTGGEVPTPDGRGASVTFEHGVVYWSPRTGAFEVHGAILAAWTGQVRTQGALGFPVSDESRTPDGRGAYGVFEGGWVWWSPGTGAHRVLGAIRDAYHRTGAEGGPLGYPVTGEVPTSSGQGDPGAHSTFERGVIAWSPETGAHPVTGGIRAFWESLGMQHGCLNFPTGPARPGRPGWVRQDFGSGWVEEEVRTGSIDADVRCHPS
ncbi:hypothetical protein NUM3379_33480 [Kineococcus sp. NUM-3379]